MKISQPQLQLKTRLKKDICMYLDAIFANEFKFNNEKNNKRILPGQ